jgi:hypothetical protein
MNTIVSLIEKFVKGKVNISKNRLYSKPKDGGLGLINLVDFVTAQQAIWVERALFFL